MNNSLHSKYRVFDANMQPLDSGTFVLRPFNADGTVRDEAAVNALVVYAEQSKFGPELRDGLYDWLDKPEAHEATTTLNIPVHAAYPRVPDVDEDLTGKVCVCSIGRVGIVSGKGVLNLDSGATKEVWQGLGVDGKGTWASSSPIVIAETLQEYHDKLFTRFGGKLSHNS